jgi:hypothetical protein
MVDISFQPTFHNTDFVDDTDLVLAGVPIPQPGDPVGFNARFTAIQADLQQLSLVVAEVDAVLSQGNSGPTQQRLTLPPTLVTPVGTGGWVIGSSGAASSTPGSSANGVLNLVLPAGGHLLSFRAQGTAAGATATITLNRAPIGGGTTQTLASVTGDASPFDRTALIDSSVALIAGASRYFVQAVVPTSSATVTIAAFQIIYSVD